MHSTLNALRIVYLAKFLALLAVLFINKGLLTLYDTLKSIFYYLHETKGSIELKFLEISSSFLGSIFSVNNLGRFENLSFFCQKKRELVNLTCNLALINISPSLRHKFFLNSLVSISPSSQKSHKKVHIPIHTLSVFKANTIRKSSGTPQ